jgi:drug/metabolite transporter (DMT)-like permease
MRWIVAVVAFIGVVILMRPDRDVISLHALLPLGMAFCFALYNVLTRVLRSENTIVNLFYTAFGVFVVMTFMTPLFWQPLTLARLWPMVVIGLTGYIGLWALDKAYAAAEPAMLAPYIFTSTIWSVALNFILFHQLPTGWWLPGILIVLGSMGYLLYSDMRTKQGSMVVSPKQG